MIIGLMYLVLEVAVVWCCTVVLGGVVVVVGDKVVVVSDKVVVVGGKVVVVAVMEM